MNAFNSFLLLSVSIIFFASSALAQVGSDLRLLVGLNSSQTNFEERPNIDRGAIQSFTGAVGFEHKPMEAFAVGADLLYTQQGYSTQVGNSPEYDINIPFLMVPVSARFYPQNWVWLGGGGYLGARLGDAQYSAGGTTTQFEGQDLSPVDYGLHVGAGLKLPLSTTSSFLVDARYNYGFAQVVENAEESAFRSIMALAGLSF